MKKKGREKKAIIGMLLGTLGARLLGNPLAGKRSFISEVHIKSRNFGLLLFPIHNHQKLVLPPHPLGRP